jgi:putative membrane protein
LNAGRTRFFVFSIYGISLQLFATFWGPLLIRIRFIVGLAITFRMQSSYSRWWEGRTQWDHLSAASRSFARTVWISVPDSSYSDGEGEQEDEKIAVIGIIHAFAVALKHHLRGEREWGECQDLKTLVDQIPKVRVALSSLYFPFHPTLILSAMIFGHLLTHQSTTMPPQTTL